MFNFLITKGITRFDFGGSAIWRSAPQLLTHPYTAIILLLGTIVMIRYVENIDISFRYRYWIVSYRPPQYRFFSIVVAPNFYSWGL